MCSGTESRFEVRSRSHIPHTAAFRTAVLQQRRLSGPCTVRWSSYDTGGYTLGSVGIAVATRGRDAPRSRVPVCTLPTRAALGALGCVPRGEGRAHVVDTFDVRSRAMCGPRERTVTVTEPPAAPVGPQHRGESTRTSSPEMPQVLRVGG